MKPPFKPGVSRSVHLFAAPFLWTVVGCLLMVRGWDWLDPGRGRLLALAALFAGTLKSLLVLDRVAARAVGSAMARNPLVYVVPCHRVIRAGGDSGHYGGGAQLKRRLLDAEAQGHPLSAV